METPGPLGVKRERYLYVFREFCDRVFHKISDWVALTMDSNLALVMKNENWWNFSSHRKRFLWGNWHFDLWLKINSRNNLVFKINFSRWYQISFSLDLELTHAHSHTHTLSLSLSWTHMDTHSHSLSLPHTTPSYNSFSQPNSSSIDSQHVH